MTNYLGPKTWNLADRTRASKGGRIVHPPEKIVKPDDVTQTYKNVFLHDPDWYEKRRPAPSIYVLARRWLVEPDVGENWDQYLSSVRLALKKGAQHSAVVPEQDDFWVIDRHDPYFVFLDNLRSGRKHICYAMSRDQVADLMKIGLTPAPIEDFEPAEKNQKSG
jgi:hypothetical protein